MPQWIWQYPEWPHFSWDDAELSHLLGVARQQQGKLLGFVQLFDPETKLQIHSRMLADEIITTSAIEGEVLNRDSVRSSIAYRLGIENAGIDGPPDRYIEGILDIVMDATEKYNEPLTIERLYGWHAALFPTGYSHLKKINVAKLRGDGEMSIVSGRPDKPTVHYIAPPYNDLNQQMQSFLNWFEKDSLEIDGLIRAGIAHLWFEALHPFDDGNGRIGRSIVDMALAQDENLATRFYSLSKQIMAERKYYYAALGKTTSGSCEITNWLTWFLNCYIHAIEKAITTINNIAMKSKFWIKHNNTILNERQIKTLNRMLDKGIDGFTGGMTTKKYMHLTKTSRATAYRELIDMVNKGCLQPMGPGGRSTAYQIVWVK